MITLITMRKCADRAEYFRAERRDATREATVSAGGDGPGAWLVALDRKPRPQEVVILAETVEHLFQDRSPYERPILESSLEGYTVSEISIRLDRAY